MERVESELKKIHYAWPSAADKRLLLRSYARLKQRTNGNLGDHLFRKVPFPPFLLGNPRIGWKCQAMENCEELKTFFFLDGLDNAMAATSHTWRKHAFLAQETIGGNRHCAAP